MPARDPLPGDFACVVGTVPQAIRDRNFGAALIQLVTKGPAYHALIYVGDGAAMEARPHGAGYVDIASYGDRLLWSTADPTAEQRAELVDSARSFDKTPYGWADDIAIGLDALGLHWPLIEKRLNFKGTVICSQLVAVCYVRAGIPLTTKDPSRVTPNDLRDVILGIPVPDAG